MVTHDGAGSCLLSMAKTTSLKLGAMVASDGEREGSLEITLG